MGNTSVDDIYLAFYKEGTVWLHFAFTKETLQVVCTVWTTAQQSSSDNKAYRGNSVWIDNRSSPQMGPTISLAAGTYGGIRTQRCMPALPMGRALDHECDIDPVLLSLVTCCHQVPGTVPGVWYHSEYCCTLYYRMVVYYNTNNITCDDWKPVRPLCIRCEALHHVLWVLMLISWCSRLFISLWLHECHGIYIQYSYST